MRHAWEHFRFCPTCGGQYGSTALERPTVVLRCPGCGYEFFQHSSPAATAVIPSALHPRRLLLLTRNTPPGMGLLGLPGGFLQYGEQPIDAVRREVREEVSLEVEVDRVLDTYLVDYVYRGARVSVMEVVFLTRPVDRDVEAIRTSEARWVGYYEIDEILRSTSRLAFPEQGQSLRRYSDSLGLF